MLSILANRTYRHLFAAQVIALLGTGLATVALGLLAWNIAGDDAGVVLGTALAIKMVAYVTLAPVASALAVQVPRRTMLVGLDVLRAVVAVALPFVTEVWQIYVLIFLMQAASAGFTPTFQATIPDVLPDEAEYTRALSLSRLAYDLEKSAVANAGGGSFDSCQFPRAVRWHGSGFSCVGSVGLVRAGLIAAPLKTSRYLGAHDTWAAPVSCDAAPAGASGPECDGRGRIFDGDCEHCCSGEGAV